MQPQLHHQVDVGDIGKVRSMKIEISRRAFIGGVASVVAVASSTGPVRALESAIPTRPGRRKFFPFPKEFDVVVKLVTPEGTILGDTIAKARLVETSMFFEVPTLNALTSGVVDHILIDHADGWIAKVNPDYPTAIAMGDTINIKEMEARWS